MLTFERLKTYEGKNVRIIDETGYVIYEGRAKEILPPSSGFEHIARIVPPKRSVLGVIFFLANYEIYELKETE